MKVSSLKTIVFILIFTLIYAVLLNISEKYYGRDLSIYQFDQKASRLRHGSATDTIILGDSRALAINFIEQKQSQQEEGNIYNYAFSNAGGMYPYPYFLKKYLRHQPAPGTIIWSFIPLMLTDEWDIFEKNPAFGSSEFYRSSRLYDLRDMLKPVNNNPFIHHPATTREVIYNKFSVRYEPIKKYFTEPYDVRVNEDLFNNETGGLLFSRQHTWNYTEENYLEKMPLQISENSEIFIKTFLELAQAKNIKVYLINMPIPAKIHEKRKISGFYQKYFDYMSNIQSRFADTLHVYDKILSYDEIYFIDESHLNEPGAAIFQNIDYPEFLEWVAEKESAKK